MVPGYASAKAGIVTLTANLAHKWAARGVRVNAVAPGVIDTPMTAPMAAFPELLDAELAHIPMGRLGRPDEVVGAMLFLCSSAAGYLTGHTVAVDGGYLAGLSDVVPVPARSRADPKGVPMLQVRVHGPGDVRVDEVPPPDPGPRDAVVRIAACGICGSDLTYIRLGGMAGPGPEPLCLGHEMAGVVDWVGDEVTRVRVGDRVVVEPGNEQLGRIGGGGPEGGLTPQLLVRQADAGLLHPVPDDLALDVAAFAEPLAVGMHAVEQADVRAGEGVAVFGCGPIGLAAVATLVDRGHERVGRGGPERDPPGPGPRPGRPGGGRPRRGRRLGGAGRPPRHDAVHVRPHPRHRRLHRGVRLGAGPDRHPASGGRWAAACRSWRCTTTRSPPAT